MYCIETDRSSSKRIAPHFGVHITVQVGELRARQPESFAEENTQRTALIWCRRHRVICWQLHDAAQRKKEYWTQGRRKTVWMGTVPKHSLTPGRRMSFTTHEPIIAKDRSVDVNISCADHDQSFSVNSTRPAGRNTA